MNVTRRALFAGIVAALLMLVAAACSEDDPVTPVEIDFTTDLPAAALQQLTLQDPSRPLDQADILHFGSTGIEAASVLMTFDFTVLAHPDSAYLLPYLTAENVRTVNLRLWQPEWYDSTIQLPPDPDRRPWPGLIKNLTIHRLDDVPGAWSLPAAEPPYSPANLATAGTDDSPWSSMVRWQLDREAALELLDAREAVGLIMREAAGSEPGILGLASESLSDRSVLTILSAGSVTGPILQLFLDETPDSWPPDREFLNLPAAWDATTWHRTPPPAEPGGDFIQSGQTGAMNLLRFALPDSLPLHRLHAAELVLTVDPDTSVGPPVSVACLDATAAMVDAAAPVWNLDDLAAATSPLDWLLIEPERPEVTAYSFDVTDAVRALVVPTDRRLALLLAGCDPSLGTGDGEHGWQFWYSRAVFGGLDRSPGVAPRLHLVFAR